MKDVINNTVETNLKKGRKLEVIRRYIRLKYRISIDLPALKERMRQNNMPYELA
jgi:hypothetical protein